MGYDPATMVAATRDSAYGYVIVTTLLICDIMSNLTREVDHIWSRPGWRQQKVLYFVTRQWAFILLLIGTLNNTSRPTSLMACRLYYVFTTTIGGIPLLTLSVNIIFIKRLRVLYTDYSKVVVFLRLLLALAVLLYTYQATIFAHAMFKATVAPTPGLPIMCLAKIEVEYQIPTWTVTLFINFCVLAMTLWWYRGSITWKSFTTRRGKRAIPPLSMNIWLDGVFFFFVIFVTFLVTLIVIAGQISHARVTRSFASWIKGVLSFTGSRLILRLREAAREDFLPAAATFPEDEQTAHDPISFSSRGR